jgi:hypothetical protein
MNTQLQYVGLPYNPNGYSIEVLLAALSEDHYNNLIRFTKYRLKSIRDVGLARQCFKEIEADDLVNESLLKLLLGEQHPSLGRRLKAKNRVDLKAFLDCVNGVISSDLWHLRMAARHRHEHEHIGDPEHDPDAINPADSRDIYDQLSREDIHRIFFKKLYQRVKNNPALLETVKDWEARFDDGDSIARSGLNPDQAHRVRLLAREIVKELGDEFPPFLKNGMEISL